MKNEIIIFEKENIKLKVNLNDETVWLTQEQMAELFGKNKSTINEHINNIFKEKELQKTEVMRKFGISEFSTKPTNFYNLDVIISVGYRVKSKRGTEFRVWANRILKEYLLKGYSINQKRLDCLEKAIQIIEIANRIDNNLETKDANEILNILAKYTKALDMLDDYDHKIFIKPEGTVNKDEINYENCIELINLLKYNETSDIFALERNRGLEGIIGNIYQTFDGKDVYPTIEEKAANFLYMIVKNHVFIDGNKRIAATLFIYFLYFYDLLYENNNQIIDNNTLAAITLLIAESNPKEKESIIYLILNFLNRK